MATEMKCDYYGMYFRLHIYFVFPLTLNILLVKIGEEVLPTTHFFVIIMRFIAMSI